jgi:phosphoglycerol transferase MdoB-like AlkP superfamily enzyme
MLTLESITHLVISMLMAVLLVITLQQIRRKSNSYGLIIVALFAGLVYENLILGLGGLIGYGDTLKALNTPRFISHALFTPMLIIWRV